MSTLLTTTSSTRPAASAGDTYFETDTNKVIVYDGSVWKEYNNDNIAGFTKSVLFDGTDDVLVAQSTVLEPANCSFSMWWKTTVDDHERIIVARAGGGTNYYLFHFQSRVIYIGKSGTVQYNWNSTYPNKVLTAGEYSVWHHQVNTHESGVGTKIYINGDLVEDSTTVHSIDIAQIGAPVTAGFAHTGYIKDVATWNTVLSADDVTALYNNGKPNDLSVAGSYDTDRTSNLTHWWRMGDGDDGAGNPDGTVVGGFGQIYDMAGSIDLDMKNGASIQTVAP